MVLIKSVSLCLSVQGYEGERLVFSWVYGIVGLRIYQFLLGVYVLVWLGSHRFNVSTQLSIFCASQYH